MSDTAIAVAPIVSIVSPLVNAAASGLVIGLGGLLFALLARATGIAFAPDYQARLERAVDAEVQAAVAAAERNLATGKFNLGNPLVAEVANALIANAPALIAKVGLNGDEIKHEVVKAIGRAQMAMTSVNPEASK